VAVDSGARPDPRTHRSLRRFEREARAAGGINHPNILTVHDVGRHEGLPFVVSELLEGQTLRQRMRGAALRSSEVIDCGVQIARGLAVAHEARLVRLIVDALSEG
jgi:serine/threonine protein kinase